MNRNTSILLASVVLLIFSHVASGAVLNRTDPALSSKASRLLVPFVKNKGQHEDPNVLFYSNTFACMVVVNSDGTIGYRLSEDKPGRAKQPPVIRERVAGALAPSPSGGRKASTKVNYFSGKDAKKWVNEIATFNSVDMGEIYRGVRLELQARANNVEKIFHVSPAADPRKIRMRIEGARALKLTPKGELDVLTGQGRMRFSKPVAYQHDGGRKTSVDVAYTVHGNAYGFQVAAYDKTKELIIDPLITAVFNGITEKRSRPACMATDSEGNIYVAGKSGNHAAVFKFNSTLREALTSTHIGTKYKSDVYDIAVDNQNAVYVVGRTSDKNFPVKDNAFDKELTKNSIYDSDEVDGFVIKYNADLNEILAATYIGAGLQDAVYGVAVDPDDNVYVVGVTNNPVSDPDGDIAPFPTTPGAYDTAYGSRSKTKAFVAHLDGNLEKLLASTLLGDKQDEGNLNDRAYAVAIDAKGNIVVAGRTGSRDFPLTPECADSKFEGVSESFVSKFDPDLQNLLASTFLGGANSEKINALAIDSNNEIVVAGWTLSSDFPVVKENFDTSYNMYEDGFVARLDSALSTLKASTFLGGSGVEQVSDIVIREDDAVLLCGGTGSSNFPVTPESDDPVFGGGDTNDFYKGDGFITILDQSLTHCEFSTFLGGRGFDHVSSIVINENDMVVAGETGSRDFPYMAEKTTGYSDAFVCRFNDDEIPDPPLSKWIGHWKSKDSGSESSIHLELDICRDGSFEGMWQRYECIKDSSCFLKENSSPEPASGKFDFESDSGTINMGADCKGIPVQIFNKEKKKVMITINPGKNSGDCLGSMASYLHYEKESENGKCKDIPVNPVKPEKEKDPDDGNGGGGGGCFIRMADGLY